MTVPRIGFDIESHLFTRGRLVPRFICLSLAWHPRAYAFSIARQDGCEEIYDTTSRCRAALLTGESALYFFGLLLEDAIRGDLELVAHNAVFDLSGMAEAAAVHPASTGPILDRVFAALDAGVVRDTMIREMLIAIAHNKLKGAPRGYFGLGQTTGLVARYLGLQRAEGKGMHSPCPSCAVDPTCPTCGGFGSVGPWRTRYAQLDGVPLEHWPQEAKTYAMDDAIDALRVCDVQDATPDTPEGPIVVDGRVVNEEAQLRAAMALHMEAAYGVCVDASAAAGLDAEVNKIASRAKAIGVRAGFIRRADGIATEDPDQKIGRPGSLCKVALHQLVSEAYGGAPPRNKPTDNEIAKAAAEGREPSGSIKADRDVLLSTGHPDLIEYAEAGEALTLARTYVPILNEGVALGPVAPGGPCGPITSSPNVLVVSGRISWRNPNFTNPPRSGGFRECIVPRPANLFLFADYGTVELRALAQICLWMGFGDAMAKAFIEGRDPHTEFAADLMGITYTEASERLASGDEEVNRQRQLAKAADYGFPGGMGGPRFASQARRQGLRLADTKQEAEVIGWELHTGFRRKWPEILTYFSWISSRTGTPDDPQRFTLRQFVSGRLRGGVGYCDGCNGYFQGLVADGAKEALWDVVKACYIDIASALYGCRPVLFLHDEIGIEVPCGDGTSQHPLDLRHLTSAADELSAVMIRAMTKYIPDIPVIAEPGACLRWRKGAPEIRDDQGLLLPVDLPEDAVVIR